MVMKDKRSLEREDITPLMNDLALRVVMAKFCEQYSMHPEMKEAARKQSSDALSLLADEVRRWHANIE